MGRWIGRDGRARTGGDAAACISMHPPTLTPAAERFDIAAKGSGFRSIAAF